MGLFMRFITPDKSITFVMIRDALRKIDAQYDLPEVDIDDTSSLFFGAIDCGVVEINHHSDDIFEDDVYELKALVGQDDSPAARQILDVLEKAQTLVVVEAIWEGDDADTALSRIDPLWDWLFDRFGGILQVDNDGFYDDSDLLLDMNLSL
jgi:hypothetical protein